MVRYFFFKKENIRTEQQYPSDILEIKTFVENCLKETGENSLVRIGEQGGYFLIFDEPSINGRIPYYLQENKESIPSQQEIEQNLAGFVREELSFCILNFKDFRERFSIDHSLENIEVKISSEKTIFKIRYPMTINKKDSESVYKLEDFNVDIPINLDKILKISNEIIKEQKLHLDSICLSCLFDLGKNYGVHVDMLDYGNSTIFTIIDDNSQINEESYEWNFAIV